MYQIVNDDVELDLNSTIDTIDTHRCDYLYRSVGMIKGGRG